MPRPLGPALRTSDCAVVLCADRKYFAPAYVLCASLMRDQPERHDVYLLTEAGPHLDRVPHDVPFNIQTPEFIGRLPNIPELVNPLTPFSYLRIFLADLFEGYRRVLYLDCDIRIDGSIAPLFRLDMKGAAIAAVDDMMTYHRPRDTVEIVHPHLGKLGFGPDDPYFNSGVLLIDCERWKRDQMTGAAIDCMNRLGQTMHGDQDVLNVAFRRGRLPLSPLWNFPPTVFETGVEAVIKPVVYHNVIQKPWEFGAASRREVRHFREAIRSTPYRDFIQRPSRQRIKRLIEDRTKRVIQNATYFLPSSHERIKARDRAEIEFAAYIIKNLRSRRFADVNQDISVIDVSALSLLIDAYTPRNDLLSRMP